MCVCVCVCVCDSTHLVEGVRVDSEDAMVQPVLGQLHHLLLQVQGQAHVVLNVGKLAINLVKNYKTTSNIIEKNNMKRLSK